MAINPANEGYVLVKNGGRQGDVKLENALGKSYGGQKFSSAKREEEGYVDECSCDDDAGAKMFYREEYPCWYSQLFDSFCYNRE
jgi:hypothetical protein